MSNQVYGCDGHLHEITAEDLKKGNVLRSLESEPGAHHSFADAIVVDVYFKDHNGGRIASHEAERFAKKDLYVNVARPYAFVSGADTCCPSVLTGVEQFEIPASRLTGPDSRYRLVVQSTGLAANHTT